ncbi:hypothetical protein P4532_13140, partial [Geobacillus stearothermophilus]|nr:hypothetical protein [Geobacillus stearothermophilus]
TPKVRFLADFWVSPIVVHKKEGESLRLFAWIDARDISFSGPTGSMRMACSSQLRDLHASFFQL